MLEAKKETLNSLYKIMTTRSDLEKIIKETWGWECVGESGWESGSVKEGEQELVDAMVAAYNRGIEDAAKSVEMKVVGKYGQLGIDRDSILKLKI